jgi:DNA-binding response OmpR family regulator
MREGTVKASCDNHAMVLLGPHLLAGPRRPGDEVLSAGPLEVYPQEQLARVEGRAIALAGRGVAVLAALTREPGEIVARPWLYREVWGEPMRRGDRSVDVQVAKLRRALADACPDWRLIRTHHGRGYSLVPERSRGTRPRAASAPTAPNAPAPDAPRTHSLLVVAGPLEITPSERLAVIDGASARLRPLDTRVLVALAQAPGRVIPREELFAAIGRAAPAPEDRTIAVAVCRLRTRLGALAPHWELIHTHIARGYRFEPTLRDAVRQQGRVARPSS